MIVYFFGFRHTFWVEANPLYPFTDYEKTLEGSTEIHTWMFRNTGKMNSRIFCTELKIHENLV